MNTNKQNEVRPGVLPKLLQIILLLEPEHEGHKACAGQQSHLVFVLLGSNQLHFGRNKGTRAFGVSASQAVVSSLQAPHTRHVQTK